MCSMFLFQAKSALLMAKVVEVGLIKKGVSVVDLSLTDDIRAFGQGKKVKAVADAPRARGELRI